MPTDLAPLTAALADRYAIERRVGEGGMATVYRARDLRHDRAVAIKVLRPELAAVIGAERFLAEIRTTANLQHPHILPLHDSGEASGHVFYVMPFIEGESLRDRLERERQLPVADAVQIVLDVAQALDYAHRHGVIHRDIKPENILLHDGRALVADFGISLAATSAGKRMTETGMSLGTPSYMSPEQAMGERALDARTDVYALGCVLYELLVGAPPFAGPTAQAIVAKVLTERPSPPSAARDTIVPGIDDVVLTSLAKVPADRQPTAAAFADALREAARGEGTTRRGARSASASALLTATPGASRRMFLAGGLVGAAVVAAVAWGVRGAGAKAAVEQRMALTFDGASRMAALSADGQSIAYVTGRCLGGPEDRCHFSVQMQEIGGARPVVLVEDAMRVDGMRWTPDGTHVVFAARLDEQRRGIYSVPRLGGVPRVVVSGGAEFDLHPRGDSLVFLRDEWAVIASLADGQRVDSVQVPLRHGRARAVAWSPDGAWFAISRDFHSLTTVGRSGGVGDSLRLPVRPHIAWDGDERAILMAVSREGTVEDIVRVAVDARGRMQHPPTVLLPKISAGGSGEVHAARNVDRLAIKIGRITLDQWRVDLTGRSAPQQLTRGTAYYGPASLTPDASALYYSRGDAMGDNLYVLDGAQREQALTRAPYIESGAVSVGPDGRRVVYAHSTPDGVRIGEMRLPSGDVSQVQSPLGEGRRWVPIGVRQYVMLSSVGDSLLVFDSLSATPRRLEIAAGRRARSLAGNRSARDVLVTLAAPDASGPNEIHRVSLEGAPSQLVLRVPGIITSLSWQNSGAIWFTRWVAGEPSISYWELSPGAAVPQRRANAPPGCIAHDGTVAAEAPAAVCTMIDARSDVWIVDGVRR